MDFWYVAAGIIGLILGIIFTYLLMAAKLSHVRENLAITTANHEKELGRIKESGLTLVTYPYKVEHGENGMIFDERRVEIGYKYQLFVNGAPCFQPHVVPTDTLTKKDINGERISNALQQATDMVMQLSELHPAIKALKSANDVTATVQKLVAKGGA
jgi:hypothetical protein